MTFAISSSFWIATFEVICQVGYYFLTPSGRFQPFRNVLTYFPIRVQHLCVDVLHSTVKMFVD